MNSLHYFSACSFPLIFPLSQLVFLHVYQVSTHIFRTLAQWSSFFFDISPHKYRSVTSLKTQCWHHNSLNPPVCSDVSSGECVVWCKLEMLSPVTCHNPSAHIWCFSILKSPCLLPEVCNISCILDR